MVNIDHFRQFTCHPLVKPYSNCSTTRVGPRHKEVASTGVDFLLHAAKFQRDGRGHRSQKARFEELRFDIAAAVSCTQNRRGAFNAPREPYATDLGFGFVFAFGALLRFAANSAATDFSTFSTSTRNRLAASMSRSCDTSPR